MILSLSKKNTSVSYKRNAYEKNKCHHQIQHSRFTLKNTSTDVSSFRFDQKRIILIKNVLIKNINTSFRVPLLGSHFYKFRVPLLGSFFQCKFQILSPRHWLHLGDNGDKNFAYTPTV